MPYLVCGLTVASEIPIPELPKAGGAAHAGVADVRVRMGEPGASHDQIPRWFMSLTRPTGEQWLACAKEPGGYRLRFPQLADFLVSADGREIVCEAMPGIPLVTTRHLLLDQVIPLVLNLRGHEALHATAVLTPDGMCAFIGPTGAGKSTLAASFLFSGCPVLSDDCLVLEDSHGAILATPAYPGIRLWDDALVALGDDAPPLQPVAHYSLKRRVGTGGKGTFPLTREPLARIYDLGQPYESIDRRRNGQAPIEGMTLRDQFMTLVASLFRLDISDRSMLARQFDFAEKVVSRVPIRRLHLPLGFSSLPAVREAILADLRQPLPEMA